MLVRGVLLVVGVQHQDAVHGAREDRVGLPWLGRHRVQHVKEVLGVAEVVARVHEGLADRVLVGPGGDGRHLGDQPEGGDPALLRIVDVEAVVVEGRQRADHAAQDRHRVRVAAEPVVEAADLLVQHGVPRDALVELLELRRVRQLAVQQQVGDLDEVGLLGELLDRVAAVEQHALIAVDVGDAALAGRGGAVAGIEGEDAELAVELADVEHVRPERAGDQRQAGAAVAAAVQGDGDAALRPRVGRAAHPLSPLARAAPFAGRRHGATQYISARSGV